MLARLIFALLWPFLEIPFHHSRQESFWDYNPDVGLIVAGGSSLNVNISRDNGLTVETLTKHPYGWTSSYKYLDGACLVIINETTLFVAGGKSE